MKIFAKLTLLISAFVALSAHADFMFEPYVGVETTKNSGKTLANVDASGDAAGKTLGLRIGSDHGFIFFALDYSRSSNGTLKFDNPSLIASYGEMKIAREVFGVTLGLDLPILLRAWAGYNFLDSMEADSTVDGKNTYKGTSTKFGLGFTGIPFVSLNVEYILRDYSSWTGQHEDANQDFENYWNEFNQATTLITVSAPF